MHIAKYMYTFEERDPKNMTIQTLIIHIVDCYPFVSQLIIPKINLFLKCTFELAEMYLLIIVKDLGQNAEHESH